MINPNEAIVKAYEEWNPVIEKEEAENRQTLYCSVCGCEYTLADELEDDEYEDAINGDMDLYCGESDRCIP